MNELKLREFVNKWCPVIKNRRHGFIHMRNVEAFGKLLSQSTEGVDNDVVHWFAYLHDIERKSDGEDPDHGKRAAEFINIIRQTYLSDLTNEQIVKLKKACTSHTTTIKTGDPTIDVCFDADRLDLPRVGIKTDPDKMATEYGKQLASKYSYDSLNIYINPMLRDRLVFGKDYIVSNYRICNFGIRVGINVNDVLRSPFASSTIWNNNAKSVCVEGWYGKSGIYAIPLRLLSEDNIYFHFMNDGFVSLLEYETDDIVSCSDEKISLSKEQYEEVKAKWEKRKGDKEAEKELLAFLEENNYTVSKLEICLRQCNLVYSAPYEEFIECYKDEIKYFARKKVDAYIRAKSRLDNYGNITDYELLNIPELPSLKI